MGNVPTINAIPTQYNGIEFRSRTEARWAVFFDELGIEWQYEPEGYDLLHGYYLPDFWLPQIDAFVEVKPEEQHDERWVELVAVTGKSLLVTAGSPGTSFVQFWDKSLPKTGMNRYHPLTQDQFDELWEFETRGGEYPFPEFRGDDKYLRSLLVKHGNVGTLSGSACYIGMCPECRAWAVLQEIRIKDFVCKQGHRTESYGPISLTTSAMTTAMNYRFWNPPPADTVDRVLEDGTIVRFRR